MLDMNQFTRKYNFRKPNQELGCELDKYFSYLPAHVFLRNVDGIYLWCNTKQAQTLNLNNSYEFCNKTAFDIIDEKSALMILNNDQEVLSQNIEKSFKESAYFVSGIEMQSIVSKKAITDPDGEVIGLIGISIEVPMTQINANNTINAIENLGLSRREAECIYYFAKGKSAKEIARIICISNRTVEKHIDNSRLKLGFVRRLQLIELVNDILEI